MSNKPMYTKEKIYLSENQLIIIGTIISLLQSGVRVTLYQISKHSNLSIDTILLNIDKLLKNDHISIYKDTLINLKKQKKDKNFDHKMQLLFDF